MSRPLQARPELLKLLGSEDMPVGGSDISNLTRWRLFIHCDVESLSERGEAAGIVPVHVVIRNSVRWPVSDLSWRVQFSCGKHRPPGQLRVAIARP